MLEHDYIELTRDASGHRAGERGTVVGLSATSALVEFADSDGRTQDLPDVPFDALRVVRSTAGASAH